MPLIYILLLILALSGSSAWSQETGRASIQQKNCTDQINQRTAATVARDWRSLERLAERYIKTCKDVHDDADIASAYEDEAIANLRTDNPKKALAISETCVDLSYSQSGCHLGRAEALIALGRTTEAKLALDIVDRLLNHLIEGNERELRDARTNIDKELFEAKKGKFAAQQRFSAALREKYL